jgi:SAM-dependent methyltransferase
VDASDPRYLSRQYATHDALQVRIETHRRYGVGTEMLFVPITRAMRDRGPLPEQILDVGAGTGHWYRTIREELGPLPRYTAVDQSAGMVQVLRAATAGDDRATAMEADAQSLPHPEASFDWIGFHFMLYHVPNIAAAIQEGWRVLRPGGLLAASTNGARPYRELWDLGDEVAHELGLPGADAGASDRFNLANGATFFPKAPELHVRTGGFRFPAADPVVRYMASGPLQAHLGEAAEDPVVFARAVELMRHRIQAVIDRAGSFDVHSESGFFLLAKD